MIKVIQVITDTNIGGAGIWLLNFLKTYNRTLIDMSVIIPSGAMLKEKIEALEVRVIEAENIADSSFSIGGIKELERIFAEEEPDIVHTHASLSARIAAKRRGIKVVHTRHCLEENKKGIKKAVYGFLNNSLSDRVIGVSKAVCKNLEADGIDSDKLRLVYNGIFPLRQLEYDERTALRKQMGIMPGNIVVGMVARLEPVKNHEMFLEAAKVIDTICPEALFLIVGSGSAEEELRQKAVYNGISDKVLFTGYINDVNDIMNVIDIHVLTSKKEALSISLLEAMSLEKPVAATDSGGPGEFIENGKNGLLVGVDDTVNLTMGIVRLIQRSDIRRRMGEAAKQTVLKQFLAENMARNIEKIYEEII